MIDELTISAAILFMLTTVLTIVWFYFASKSRTGLFLIIGWTILQSLLALQGVYQDTTAMPPKLILLGVFPTVVIMVVMFFTKGGKAFIDNLNLKTLTYFHSIRIPVEIVLALLFHAGVVSIYMTYEGTNFDIFSGVTAALVAFLAFKSNTTNKKLLLWWNVICLLLLLNVVITAVFALPTPYQQLSLDQPNSAILRFPFSLLPTVVVPLVMFSHFATIRRLLK